MPGADGTLNIGVNAAYLLNSLNSSLTGAEKSIKPLRISLNSDSFSRPLGRITGSVNEFNKSLDASNARVLAFGASAGIIYGIVRAFKEMTLATVNVEKNLAEINVILNSSSKELRSFSQELFKISKDTGQTFYETAEAAKEFARQGLNASETLKRVRDAAILSRLANISQKESMEALTAAVNSFSRSILTTTDVINKMARVDANFAVSTKDLAEAIKRVGSAAEDVGVDINELMGIVTSAQQITSRGGAVIGNALKTIFQRISRPEIIEQLQMLGVNITSAQDGLTKLKNISDAVNRSSPGAATQIKQLAANVYQYNILSATLTDLGKKYSITNRAIEDSNSATNEALKRNEELNQTLDAQFKRLTNNLTQFGANFGNKAVSPTLGGFTKLLNSLLEGVNTEGVGQQLAEGIFKGFGSFLSGPGALLIVLTLGGAFKKFAIEAGGAAKSILGINQASLQREQIEKMVVDLLRTEPALLEGIRNKSMGVLEVQQAILNTIKQTLLIQESAKVFAGPISAGLRGAVSLKEGKWTVPKSAKSEGHIPEVIGALKGGYIPGEVKKMIVPEMGEVTYNTAEKVKYFPFARQPAIMPPRESNAGQSYKQAFQDRYNIDPYMSEGYIPNFALYHRKVGFPQEVTSVLSSLHGKSFRIRYGPHAGKAILDDINKHGLDKIPRIPQNSFKIDSNEVFEVETGNSPSDIVKLVVRRKGDKGVDQVLPFNLEKDYLFLRTAFHPSSSDHHATLDESRYVKPVYNGLVPNFAKINTRRGKNPLSSSPFEGNIYNKSLKDDLSNYPELDRIFKEFKSKGLYHEGFDSKEFLMQEIINSHIGLPRFKVGYDDSDIQHLGKGIQLIDKMMKRETEGNDLHKVLTRIRGLMFSKLPSKTVARKIIPGSNTFFENILLKSPNERITLKSLNRLINTPNRDLSRWNESSYLSDTARDTTRELGFGNTMSSRVFDSLLSEDPLLFFRGMSQEEVASLLLFGQTTSFGERGGHLGTYITSKFPKALGYAKPTYNWRQGFEEEGTEGFVSIINRDILKRGFRASPFKTEKFNSVVVPKIKLSDIIGFLKFGGERRVLGVSELYKDTEVLKRISNLDSYKINELYKLLRLPDEGIFANVSRGNYAKGLIPNFVKGHIPNFNPLLSAIKRETVSIPSSLIRIGQDSRLTSRQNPAGLGVYNLRDEPAGLSQGVNRAFSEGLNPKNYGVPNFANEEKKFESFTFGQSFLQKYLMPEISKLKTAFNKGEKNINNLFLEVEKLRNTFNLTGASAKKLNQVLLYAYETRLGNLPDAFLAADKRFPLFGQKLLTQGIQPKLLTEGNKGIFNMRLPVINIPVIDKQFDITGKISPKIPILQNIQATKIEEVQNKIAQEQARRQSRDFKLQAESGAGYFNLGMGRESLGPYTGLNQVIGVQNRYRFPDESSRYQATLARMSMEEKIKLNKTRLERLQKEDLAKLHVSSLLELNKGFLESEMQKEASSLQGAFSFSGRRRFKSKYGEDAYKRFFGGNSFIKSFSGPENVNKLFGMSFVAPMVGESIANVFSQETKGGRIGATIASGAGQAFSYGAFGAMMTKNPMMGGAVGLVAGGLLSIYNIIKAWSDDTPEIERRFENARSSFKQTTDSLSNFMQVSQKLASVYSGETRATKGQVKELGRERVNYLLGLSIPDRRRLLDAKGDTEKEIDIISDITYEESRKMEFSAIEKLMNEFKKDPKKFIETKYGKTSKTFDTEMGQITTPIKTAYYNFTDQGREVSNTILSTFLSLRNKNKETIHELLLKGGEEGEFFKGLKGITPEKTEDFIKLVDEFLKRNKMDISRNIFRGMEDKMLQAFLTNKTQISYSSIKELAENKQLFMLQKNRETIYEFTDALNKIVENLQKFSFNLESSIKIQENEMEISEKSLQLKHTSGMRIMEKFISPEFGEKMSYEEIRRQIEEKRKLDLFKIESSSKVGILGEATSIAESTRSIFMGEIKGRTSNAETIKKLEEKSKELLDYLIPSPEDINKHSPNLTTKIMRDRADNIIEELAGGIIGGGDEVNPTIKKYNVTPQTGLQLIDLLRKFQTNLQKLSTGYETNKTITQEQAKSALSDALQTTLTNQNLLKQQRLLNFAGGLENISNPVESLSNFARFSLMGNNTSPFLGLAGGLGTLNFMKGFGYELPRQSKMFGRLQNQTTNALTEMLGISGLNVAPGVQGKISELMLLQRMPQSDDIKKRIDELVKDTDTQTFFDDLEISFNDASKTVDILRKLTDLKTNSEKEAIKWEQLNINVLREKNRIFQDDFANQNINLRMRRILTGEIGKKQIGGEMLGTFIESNTFGENEIFRDLLVSVKEFSETFKSSLNDAFKSVIMGAKSGGEALRDFGLALASKVLDRSLDLTTNMLFNTLFGSQQTGGILGTILGRNKGGLVKYAGGGEVVGGSGIKDDVPAFLSRGEYVIRKDSVNKVGRGFLNMLNNGGISRFDAGGRVGMVMTNQYLYDDPRYPSSGRINVDSRLSNYALSDENNPQNALRMQREEDLYAYIRERQDYETNKKYQIDLYKHRQSEGVKMALIQAGVGIAAAGMSSGIKSLNTRASKAKLGFPISDPMPNVNLRPTRAFQPIPVGGASGGYASDNVPALLTGGEYVINRGTVNRFGVDFFNRINRGQIPTYANGGVVGSSITASQAQNDSYSRMSEMMQKLVDLTMQVRDSLEKNPINRNNIQNNQGTAEKTGGINNNINISVSVQSGTETKSETSVESGGNNEKNLKQSKELAEIIKGLTVKTIIEQQRPGGTLYNGNK